MKDYDTYLNEILREIDRLESKKIKYLFRIQDKIPDYYEKNLKEYFKNSDKYVLQTRKCMSCTNTWEIIIEILYRTLDK